ncbi:MAG TPA: flagellar basal body L-ring protein FlgH [Candidatus Omnitrophota bacterium]|nr:flagellar basal body L-ring protein FlgH [Candidatus Omnitrophota bacterium]
MRDRARASGLVLALLLFLGLATAAGSDSLYKVGQTGSPYTPEKSFRVGDIITVLVVESSSAQHKAGTNSNVSDDFGVKFVHTLERLNPLIGPSSSVNGDLSQKYGGTGSTQRESNIQAKIAAEVTEVMENGNLRIEGKHTVRVNDENQEILVSGVVRSKDVTITNTIYSYQVADADISIKGSGTVQEAEAPGWFTRILNWLF